MILKVYCVPLQLSLPLVQHRNELLPRDVVSKAVYEQIENTKTPYVYLDIRFLYVFLRENKFKYVNP